MTRVSDWKGLACGRRAAATAEPWKARAAGNAQIFLYLTMQSRIMYIENKSVSLSGEARIGRVSFSKTMRTMYYDGKEFLKVKNGFKHNCIEVETGDEYWISGCHKDGADRLYGEKIPVQIDDDVREEYWTSIRNNSESILKTVSN